MEIILFNYLLFYKYLKAFEFIIKSYFFLIIKNSKMKKKYVLTIYIVLLQKHYFNAHEKKKKEKKILLKSTELKIVKEIDSTNILKLYKYIHKLEINYCIT